MMIGAMIRQRSNSEHFDPAQNDADDSRSGGIRQKIETEIATKIQPCLEKRGGVCYNQ